MFSFLNKIFSGSDLLQRYWLYTTNKLHCNRSDINAIYEKLSVTSLQTAGDFHRVMRQYHTAEAAINILANKLPTDANLQFCRSLLQNFTRTPTLFSWKFALTSSLPSRNWSGLLPFLTVLL